MHHHNLFYQDNDYTEWSTIKAEVFATVMDFFTSGLPVVNEDAEANSDTCIY